MKKSFVEKKFENLKVELKRIFQGRSKKNI